MVKWSGSDDGDDYDPAGAHLLSEKAAGPHRRRSWDSGKDPDHHGLRSPRPCDEEEPATPTNQGRTRFREHRRRGFVLCLRTPTAVVLCSAALWVLFYLRSLEGGDLMWIVARLGVLGAYLFISIALFVLAVLVTVFARGLPRRTRAGLLGSLSGTCIGLLIYDHDESLYHHGGYNALIFALVAMPALAVGAAEIALWNWLGPRRAAAWHSLALFIGIFVVAAQLSRAAAVWGRGFNGEMMQPLSRTCKPTKIGLPWVDLLPAGIQNFWAGGPTCGPATQAQIVKSFSAELDFEGQLHVKCSADDATYVPLPETSAWPPEWKMVEENYEGKLREPFNKRVMDAIRGAGRSRIRGDGVPVTLSPNKAEAAIVSCGGKERLVLGARRSNDAVDRTRSNLPEQIAASNDGKALDVLVVFLDATSRRHFHRRLPRTVKTLEQAHLHGNTRLHQFFRYSISGFSTGPNSRAMFTGTSPSSLEPVSAVWEDFARAGFVTAITADTCQDWGASYNPRPAFHFDHEMYAPFCHADFFSEGSNPLGNFKGPYAINSRCLKGERVSNLALRYAGSVSRAYPDRNTFTLAWLLEGHEGTGEVLAELDDGLVTLLSNLDWNKTAVMIAADHGLHMGLNFAFARNGAVEHRNPMLAFALPPWLAGSQGRGDRMQGNAQKVVSGLDVYATLQGLRKLVGGSDFDDPDFARRARGGRNLMEDVIPPDRTCSDAGIPLHYCECY
ncbi:hypothetical protein HDU86_006545 [Geranomyces michiganensis]|nr:hypothetical protein HDU86_006545 [Geranomyces michiganensis]